jgi:endonuclease/exonuclease/phosphatase family metal-dependent hydrolase
MPPGTLKVLTYNIHKGFNVNRQFMLPAMQQAIAHIDADFVFLQEVRGEHLKQQRRIKNWPLQSQAEFLAGDKWPYYVYGKNAIYPDGHHGNALLSKHPLLAWENINLTTQLNASRSMLHAVIQPSHSLLPLHIICIHLGLFKRERAYQLQALSARIETLVPHHEPLIIAGDFNDWRAHAKNYLETSLDVKEIFQTLTGDYARTFPVWGPVLRVDRIYYRALQPVSCSILAKKPWLNLSDHSALYAEFSW